MQDTEEHKSEEHRAEKAEHKHKKIVIPGDMLTDQRKKLGGHVFVENGKVYSDALGITYLDSPVATVVPLHGKYLPVQGDTIVGIMHNETFNGYILDINSIYHSFVSKEWVRDPLKRGDVVSATISEVNEINEAELTDVRSFQGGDVIEVSPVKIPRIVGKNGSMLAVLRNLTGCTAIIGRNGWIWITGGDVAAFVDAVRLIEKESHLDNLTTRVEGYLKERTAKSKKADE